MRRALPLLLPVALIACSPATPPADSAATPAAAPADLPDAATADHAATLGAYHWRLVDARDGAGAPIAALLAEGGAPLQLDFRDGGVSVSNACNRINASVTLDDDRLEVGPAVSTQMACLDERLAGLEREIGARLPGTHRLAVTAGKMGFWKDDLLHQILQKVALSGTGRRNRHVAFKPKSSVDRAHHPIKRSACLSSAGEIHSAQQGQISKARLGKYGFHQIAQRQYPVRR